MADQNEPLTDAEFELLKTDYEVANSYYAMLADIRLKLIAVIPTITGVGVLFLSRSDITPETAVAASLLGLLATFGVILYDLRNTHLYDAVQQRLQVTEWRLGLRGLATTL